MGTFLVKLTPVDRRNLTSDDSDSTAGVRGIFPNVIVTGTQPRKDRSEDWPVLNSPFQDLDMDALRGVAWADLDFPTAQLRIGINDQCPDVLPNIQHDAFGMDPVNVLLSHFP